MGRGTYGEEVNQDCIIILIFDREDFYSLHSFFCVLLFPVLCWYNMFRVLSTEVVIMKNRICEILGIEKPVVQGPMV